MRAERLARARRMRLSTMLWLGLAALALLGGVCGCVARRYLSPNRLPYETLSAPYRLTQLKASTTLDVLGLADAPPYQLDSKDVGRQFLNQGDSTIALSGRSDDTFKAWVNLIAFDESRRTARRKYFFCSDERATVVPDDPGRVLVPPRRGLVFDCQCVLPPEIVTAPYATEEARLIATVRWLVEQLNGDLRAVTGDTTRPMQTNELISLAGMMMNQTFRGVLGELARTPGLTLDLAGERGVAFPHVSLDQGRIHLAVINDVVTVKIRVNLPME